MIDRGLRGSTHRRQQEPSHCDIICHTDDCDCQLIVGGDFNVDFSTDQLHTALLNSFCDNVKLNVIVRNDKGLTDYTYNFNLDRFNIPDQFLLSGNIFDIKLKLHMLSTTRTIYLITNRLLSPHGWKICMIQQENLFPACCVAESYRLRFTGLSLRSVIQIAR